MGGTVNEHHDDHDDRDQQDHRDQHDHEGHQGHKIHHAHMVADFRRRFWISLALTVPVLLLAPLIQEWLGLAEGLEWESDAQDVAEAVAGELGLDEYFAGVLPDARAAKVKEIRERGVRVAMTGDGVNDAPVPVEADLGIAIGAGTDVAMESADIVLVRSDPRDVVAVIELSRATYRKMIQNLWWATGYNVVAIPLAAGVLFWAGILLSPAVGAVLMSISTVVVAVNARLPGRWEGVSEQGTG